MITPLVSSNFSCICQALSGWTKMVLHQFKKKSHKEWYWPQAALDPLMDTYKYIISAYSFSVSIKMFDMFLYLGAGNLFNPCYINFLMKIKSYIQNKIKYDCSQKIMTFWDFVKTTQFIVIAWTSFVCMHCNKNMTAIKQLYMILFHCCYWIDKCITVGDPIIKSFWVPLSGLMYPLFLS